MKRSLICLALPVILIAGGCSNEESKKEDKIEVAETESVSYEEQMQDFSNSFYEGLKKLEKPVEQDSSLFTVREEYEKALNELIILTQKPKAFQPDSKYELQHKKFVRSMELYNEAFIHQFLLFIHRNKHIRVPILLKMTFSPSTERI